MANRSKDTPKEFRCLAAVDVNNVDHDLISMVQMMVIGRVRPSGENVTSSAPVLNIGVWLPLDNLLNLEINRGQVACNLI